MKINLSDIDNLPPDMRRQLIDALAGAIGTRVQAGATARAVGQAFEVELEAYHESLQRAGLALVRKTGPQVGFRRSGEPYVVGPGISDYAGVLAGGRAVYLEAKTTRNAERFTPHRGSDHQLDFLLAAQALGAVAGYLVRWSRHDETRFHAPARTLARVDGTLLDGVDWYAALTQEGEI